MEDTWISAGTFVELLGRLEDWKLDNDNYDTLVITIVKEINTPRYNAILMWTPCEENNK